MDNYEASWAECRRRVVYAITERRSGHLCASMSVLDILLVLLQREWEPDSRTFSGDVVLSKGHAAPALYAVLGFLDDSLPPLSGLLRRINSPYEGHPRNHALNGVLVSTGSLGLGLAWSVGRAIASERLGRDRYVSVVVSDGELQCGISYEALRVAARESPTRLRIIVDHNGWQTDGPTVADPSVMLRSLGLSVHDVDGHDPQSIQAGLELQREGPVVLVARTKRCAGLGMPFELGPEIYGESIDSDSAALLVNVASGQSRVQ